MTSDIPAAIWSALAASAAALAAFLTWAAQRRLLRESFRPEIIASGWSRSPSVLTGYDTIFLKTVKNAGRGTAGPVVINASAIADDNRPMYGMSTINIASLEPGETVDVSAEITIYWNNVALGPAKTKALGINVDAYYWDALDMRHMTRMSLFVVQDAQPFALGSSVAPGVALSTVHTTSVPVWRLKFKRSVWRVPLLGRFGK